MIKTILLTIFILLTSSLMGQTKEEPKFNYNKYEFSIVVIEMENSMDVGLLYEEIFGEKLSDNTFLHGFQFISEGKCVVVIPYPFGYLEARAFRLQVAGHELAHCIHGKFHPPANLTGGGVA